jgi:hypothetical protein
MGLYKEAVKWFEQGIGVVFSEDVGIVRVPI